MHEAIGRPAAPGRPVPPAPGAARAGRRADRGAVGGPRAHRHASTSCRRCSRAHRESSAPAVSRIIRQLLRKRLVTRLGLRHRRPPAPLPAHRARPDARSTRCATTRRRAIDAIWMDLDPRALAAFTEFSGELIARLEAYAGASPPAARGGPMSTDAVREGLRRPRRAPAAVRAVPAPDGAAPHPRGHVAAGVLDAARPRAAACSTPSARSRRSTTSSRPTARRARSPTRWPRRCCSTSSATAPSSASASSRPAQRRAGHRARDRARSAASPSPA